MGDPQVSTIKLKSVSLANENVKEKQLWWKHHFLFIYRWLWKDRENRKFNKEKWPSTTIQSVGSLNGQLLLFYISCHQVFRSLELGSTRIQSQSDKALISIRILFDGNSTNIWSPWWFSSQCPKVNCTGKSNCLRSDYFKNNLYSA